MAQRFLELGAPAEEQDENEKQTDTPAAAPAAANDGSTGAQVDAVSSGVSPMLGLHRKKQAAQEVRVEERAGLVEACMAL
jgi:hypothetical protein